MRLVDADELLQTVSIKSVFGNDINKMKCGELRTILKMIEDAPTVEPPRMRGKWVRTVLGSTNGYGTTVMYQCSECECMSISKYNYCPNCGAKMFDPQESEVKKDVSKTGRCDQQRTDTDSH